MPPKAGALPLDRGRDSLTHHRGRLTHEITWFGGTHRKPHVEAVEQGGGEPTAIPRALDLAAVARRRAEPARARVGARDEEEVGRKRERERLTCDANDALFERLSQRIERTRRELAELVEEQHAAMRHRDLAGVWATAAPADERGN